MRLSRRTSELLVGIVCLAILSCGCCARKSMHGAACAPYVSPRSELVARRPDVPGGVTADFDGIEDYRLVRQDSAVESVSEIPVAVDLEEVIQAAANNAPLADLIDAERHALRCRADQDGLPALDTLLQGESLEQRNHAAGSAAKLFLQLVAVNLQRQLLIESKQHFNELDLMIQDAAGAGFATADFQQELAQGRDQIRANESKLDSTQWRLNCQLNELVRLDTEQLVRLNPIHELKPIWVRQDAAEEISIADAQRPILAALGSVAAMGIPSDGFARLLKQLDPHLGSSGGISARKQRLVVEALTRRLANSTPDRSGLAVREQQLQQILETEKSKVRMEVRLALIDIQNAFEQLAITNETIQRLESHQLQLAAKKELDARTAFAETNENWLQLQAARSDRISRAIDYEIAVIELAEAQGILVGSWRVGSACSRPSSAANVP